MDLNNKIVFPQGASEILLKEIFLEDLERETEKVTRERRLEQEQREEEEKKKITDETGFGGY